MSTKLATVSPSSTSGLGADVTALRAALIYEFRMQVRRPALWVTFGVFTALLALLFNQGPIITIHGYFAGLVARESLPRALADWCFALNTYLPLCVGCLIAGRLSRDRRTRMEEIFMALPATVRARLAGKYVGTLLASVLPMLAVYIVGVGYLAVLAHNPLALLVALVLALPTFLIVAAPGLCFVAACSLALSAIIWVPIYQFLFIGYWYWNTLWFHANLPNLARTLLSPIGLYIVMGIYGLDESGTGPQHPIHITGTAFQGIASIAVLFATSVLILLALERLLTWRQARL